MACRAGITTDLERRKSEHDSKYENLRGWQEFGPFADRETAEDWEGKTAKAHGCEQHHGGDDPDDPNADWYGYHFYHDGEK